MLVELDIFSGRPNPRWELDARSAERLRAIHEGLRGSGAPPLEPPGLGYRGFRYTMDGVTWHAFSGMVAGSAGHLRDPGRRVERFLLETLPADHDDLRIRLAHEIEHEG